NYLIKNTKTNEDTIDAINIEMPISISVMILSGMLNSEIAKNYLLVIKLFPYTEGIFMPSIKQTV
ncbi:hypothetical protein V2A85_16560, partial [Yersinia sp. 1252 StPb PI]